LDVPAMTSLTPYVAVVVLPWVMGLGDQLRFALMGSAATIGTNAKLTSASRIEMTASFLCCNDFMNIQAYV